VYYMKKEGETPPATPQPCTFHMDVARPAMSSESKWPLQYILVWPHFCCLCASWVSWCGCRGEEMCSPFFYLTSPMNHTEIHCRWKPLLPQWSASYLLVYSAKILGVKQVVSKIYRCSQYWDWDMIFWKKVSEIQQKI
jgi:hypothetical protein